MPKDLDRLLAQFIESFESGADCFKFIDVNLKGYILPTDWANALQIFCATSAFKLKVKTVDSFIIFTHL